MIPSEKGLVFSVFWYVTSKRFRKKIKFSSHVRGCILMLPEQAPKRMYSNTEGCKSVLYHFDRVFMSPLRIRGTRSFQPQILMEMSVDPLSLITVGIHFVRVLSLLGETVSETLEDAVSFLTAEQLFHYYRSGNVSQTLPQLDAVPLNQFGSPAHAHYWGCLAQLLGSIVTILDIPLIYVILYRRTFVLLVALENFC